MALGAVYLYRTFAATSATSAEAETGVVAGNAAVVSGAPAGGASAAKTVRFGAAAPSGNCAGTTNTAKPPSGGYFDLRPAGTFGTLPSDAQAAAQVKCSKWEPRPANDAANNTVPTGTLPRVGDGGMQNSQAVFGRVTGNFKGTTDEIIQWASIKWGLSDDMVRAVAYAESQWWQNRKDANGQPVPHYGYGDYGNCPATSRYPASGPGSYGITQVKWCTHNDDTGEFGPWPWAEDSTAYNLDYYGALIRGCNEGWDYVGTAGDIWGCVGRWFSGDWYDTAANNYINTVKSHLNGKPWLQGDF